MSRNNFQMRFPSFLTVFCNCLVFQKIGGSGSSGLQNIHSQENPEIATQTVIVESPGCWTSNIWGLIRSVLVRYYWRGWNKSKFQFCGVWGQMGQNYHIWAFWAKNTLWAYLGLKWYPSSGWGLFGSVLVGCY